MEDKLSHLESSGKPTMVDVGDKQVTQRFAEAQSIVILNEAILAEFKNGDIYTKKGSVFHTAIIAGTMAVKKTADLIPFCHPLPVDSIKLDIFLNEAQEVVIHCKVKVTGKTGVEMEALTGATVAALTIYDMCKALSHHIIIKETKLLKKTGGKKDFKVES